jgi:ATP-binding protein involved in chromosome partitioning
MSAIPRAIRQGGPATLEIEWQDGTTTRYDVRSLRLACPCAGCVDELTGERRLNPDLVPDDVKPVNIRSVGNYAVSIAWSDGHDTGIYTYERLRQLGDPS